ncbi:MAG TPA: molecular chaperone HtpG [Verrucomicrobiales bacterium]|nr:molecular chaperone HtpG [Verrucomicrobiales bacterium]HIL70212.1 molecular chaperone HtpG [Verrucomicrobiota bacterium]
MSDKLKKQAFQAEIQQVLDIVIHSLYTDKEIFVRELISNSSDALEKLRFLQASGTSVHQADVDLKITLETDEKAKTLTIRDTGIGMTQEELEQNLGTIAHSDSKGFLDRFKEAKKEDASLIGQFGVGFYSVFMVADKICVYTRSYREDTPGYLWESSGMQGYEISEAENLDRGTKIVVHLKDDQKEFSEEGTIEQIIKRYSNFVPFPVESNGKTINTVKAIWAKSKNDIKEEEYGEFYRYIGHDSEDPFYHLHFSSDVPLAIQSLLYVPSKNFELLGMAKSESEVNLYCRKVLIESRAEHLFPDWLRFLKGVVDSEDLPLNISRESMQDSTLIAKINKVLTSRFIKFLGEQAKKDPEKFDKFFEEYGRFIKEGITTDYAHRDALSKLLRYESSGLDKGNRTFLQEYVERMSSDQKEIYYLTSPNREAAESNPYFEGFKAKKIEVLFLYDPWDEFVMEHLREFDGKTLVAAEKATIDLDDQERESEQKSLDTKEGEELTGWIKSTLGDRVQKVRISKRLVDSPAVVLDSDAHMTSTMRKMMKAMKKGEGDAAEDEAKVDLEINPSHPIIRELNQTRVTNDALASKVTEQILDSCLISAGLMGDPRVMLNRMNDLILNVLKK